MIDLNTLLNEGYEVYARDQFTWAALGDLPPRRRGGGPVRKVLDPRVCTRCGSEFHQRATEGPKRFSERRYCQRFCYHPNEPKGWTPERVEWLRRLRAEGNSKGMIAQIMGVTRNSVVGKLDRLKAPSIVPTVFKPASSSGGRSGPKRPPRSKAKYPTLAEFNAAIPVRQRVALFDLTGANCHWPVGEVGEPGFFFCGAPVDFAPYCPAHDHYAHEVIPCQSTSTNVKRQPTFVPVPGKRMPASLRGAGKPRWS